LVKGKNPDHRPRWCSRPKNLSGNGVTNASNGPGGVSR
jgi:hypothetical protein